VLDFKNSPSFQALYAKIKGNASAAIPLLVEKSNSAFTALTLRSLSPARYKGILSFTPTIGAPQQSVSYIDIAFHFPSHEYTEKHYFFFIKGEINHLLTLNLMVSIKLFYINETPHHNTSRICVSYNHKSSPKTQLLPQGTPREYSFQKVSLY